MFGQKFKFMENFFRCKKCLFPNTKPSLHFDENGVCFACLYTDYHDEKIDWDKKKEEFFNICKEIKKNKQNDYDCIIPVSGGKDSTYQTHLITKIGELKPLLVSFEPSYPTKIGEYNLNNLTEKFNCDLIQLRKSKQTYSRLAKIGLEIVGDHEWPNHVGIFTWPVQVADKLNIKYIFYGESTALIGMGRWDYLVNQTLIDRNWVEEHSGMNGLRVTDILDFDPTLKKSDLIPYFYPDEKSLEKKNIVPYFTGSFFQWDHQKIIKFISKEYGWKTADEPTEGDYANWEDLDCGFMPMHQYFKFIKYGYARATDHAAYEIKRGRLKKSEAKELILNSTEGKIPKKLFKEFLSFLNISEERFFELRDKFTNPILFKKDNKDKFIVNSDNDLTPNDEWFESFN